VCKRKWKTWAKLYANHKWSTKTWLRAWLIIKKMFGFCALSPTPQSHNTHTSSLACTGAGRQTEMASSTSTVVHFVCCLCCLFAFLSFASVHPSPSCYLMAASSSSSSCHLSLNLHFRFAHIHPLSFRHSFIAEASLKETNNNNTTMSARSSGLVAAAALPVPSSSSSVAGGDVPRPPPRRRAASVAGQQQTRQEFGNGYTPRRSLAAVVSLHKCR